MNQQKLLQRINKMIKTQERDEMLQRKAMEAIEKKKRIMSNRENRMYNRSEKLKELLLNLDSSLISDELLDNLVEQFPEFLEEEEEVQVVECEIVDDDDKHELEEKFTLESSVIDYDVTKRYFADNVKVNDMLLVTNDYINNKLLHRGHCVAEIEDERINKAIEAGYCVFCKISDINENRLTLDFSIEYIKEYDEYVNIAGVKCPLKYDLQLFYRYDRLSNETYEHSLLLSKSIKLDEDIFGDETNSQHFTICNLDFDENCFYRNVTLQDNDEFVGDMFESEFSRQAKIPELNDSDYINKQNETMHKCLNHYFVFEDLRTETVHLLH